MKSMSAHKAENAFGSMINTVRAVPARIEKHGHDIAVDDCERLNGTAAETGNGHEQRRSQLDYEFHLGHRR